MAKPVHFEEHQGIKHRVEDKVYDEVRHPSLIPNVPGKAASAATAGAKHGTEELLEVLTQPQGRDFVRQMATSVVQGYLDVAMSQTFSAATRQAAAAGCTGGLDASAAWLQRAAQQMLNKVDPRGPASVVPRCASMLLAVLGGLLLLLLLGATVLVWKRVVLGGC